MEDSAYTDDLLGPEGTSSGGEDTKQSFLDRFSDRHIFIGLGAVVLVAVLLLGAFFVLSPRERPGVGRYAAEEVVGLVADKISASAAIKIYLPEGIALASARDALAFDPEIDGTWVEPAPEEEAEESLRFKPTEPLRVGTYYAVVLEASDGIIRDDFYADEDPEVVAVFPKSESEANEYSAVTIVFNRPIVPLTTLDVLEEDPPPIRIEPETEGRFKWITTKNLQFIPKERLQRSSNYTVIIEEGLTSLDGLAVPPATYTFHTRPLRYEHVYSGTTVYSQPIRLTFNQPVDLQRLVAEMELQNLTEGRGTGFIAEYAIREVYDPNSKTHVKAIDRSIVRVYNERDRHGRSKFWDFETSYVLTIKRAFPVEGDINLEEERRTSISVGRVIAGISATSERSDTAEQHFFDPEGKLWVRFHEAVDLDASKIESDLITERGYGEKCKEGGEIEYTSEDDCEKEPDREEIFLKFDAGRLGRGEVFKISFIEIVNDAGDVLNPETIVEGVTTYPEFTIIDTNPREGTKGADVTVLHVCTTMPLAAPEAGAWGEMIAADLDMEEGYWGQSRRVLPSDREPKACEVGIFHTRISYGLVPETSYTFALALRDHINETVRVTFSFTTGQIPDYTLNFYHFQSRYTVTTPEKMKLTYAGENMEFVDMNICAVTPFQMLTYLENAPHYTDSPSILDCTGSQDHRLTLPSKFWVKNHFQVQLSDYLLDPIGHYVLTFSNPDYRQGWGEKKQIFERTYVTVTRLSVAEKRVQRFGSLGEPDDGIVSSALAEMQNLYWVTEIGSIAPVQGARIDLYTEPKSGEIVRAETAYTDQSGVARTPSVWNPVGAIITSGPDSAIVYGRYQQQLQSASSARAADRAYLYTDRPIYKPGDTVHLKGLFRIGFDGDYEIVRDIDMDIEIFDSKGEMIERKENLAINEYGTFSTDVKLAGDAALGTYRIQSSHGQARFDVEEYEPSPFKLEATTDQEEYIAGDTFVLDVDAEYYFGVPLEGGEISYGIAAQNYYFDRFKGEYFNFGRSWYYCEEDCFYGDQFVLRGTTQINSSGRARVSHKLDFDAFFKSGGGDSSKIFVLYIKAQNLNGQTVATQHSFIVHRGEFYFGVKTDKYFVSKNQPVTVRVKTVDTQGEEVQVHDAELAVDRIVWKSYRRQEVDGGYYYRWKRERERAYTQRFSTDREGDWSTTVTLADEGSYEITVRGTDSRENPIKQMTSLYVYGEAQASTRPTNDTSLEVVAERQDVNVGDQARIVVTSPYARAKALIAIERGRIFDYEIVDVNQSIYSYTFTVEEEYIPNIFISVLLLSPDPEVKYGQLTFDVNTDRAALTVEVDSNKTFYLPGEEVELTITSKDYRGRPVAADVSVAVVDLSVLALKGNPKKNPLVFFYSGFPLAVSTLSNLKNVLVEIEIPSVADSAKGGGGVEPDDLARRKRGVFRDTAYWQASLVTDENGEATVRFTLPDNLTSWQAETLGITKDTKVGVGYHEFTSRKELMVVPLKPRFIVPGDNFLVGAKIFNQTKKRQKLSVTLSETSLTVADDLSQQDVSIAAGETQIVYFDVTAPATQEDGSHAFTLSAKNEDFEDTVVQTIPITPNNTYETVATAGFTRANQTREYVYYPSTILRNKGGLTVNSSATLAVFLSDSLRYMADYPYGCSEQIVSKLGTIATIKRGLALENVGDKLELEDVEFEGKTYTVDEVVAIGLSRIYQNATTSGGFTYYPDWQKPSFYLTLHVVNTLEDLRRAGYDIRQDILSNAAMYLVRELNNPHHGYHYSRETTILTSYTVSRLEGLSHLAESLKSRVSSYANDEKFIAEEISSTTLAYLALTLHQGDYSKELQRRVYEVLQNRIAIDGRGAHLAENPGRTLWFFYETPVKNTALLVKVFAEYDDEHPLLDKVLRWIFASRAKDGAWGSTHNTLSVVDALTDFLEWQGETEAEFRLGLEVGDQELASFEFNAETILSTFSKFIPVADFGEETLTPVTLRRENRNDKQTNFYYDMVFRYFLPTEGIPPRDEGMSVERAFFRLDDLDSETPVTEAVVGEVLRGRLTITVPTHRNFVSIEDFIPAGVELVNFNLATEDQTLRKRLFERDVTFSFRSGRRGFASLWRSLLGAALFPFADDEEVKFIYEEGPRRDVERTLYPDTEELHRDRIFLFEETMRPGVYEYEYFVRALIPGTYQHLPVTAFEMYMPENFGRTGGAIFTVRK